MSDRNTPPPGDPGWWRTDPPNPRPESSPWPQPPPGQWGPPPGPPQGPPGPPQGPPGPRPGEPWGQPPGQPYPFSPSGPFDPSGPPGPPPRRRRSGWLLGGIAALVVALIGAGAVVLTSRDSTDADAADASTTETTETSAASEPTTPVPTGTFTDGLTSTSPTTKPTAKERKRTLKDVDQGLLVYDDVYVKPAKGWTKRAKTKLSIQLVGTGKGIYTALADPAGYDSRIAARGLAKALAQRDHMYGVKYGAVRKLKPANSNISSQAQISFTGRLRTEGVTLSLSGRCTAMTGVESIHNVTVSTCVVALKETAGAAFRDAARMNTSVARSI